MKNFIKNNTTLTVFLVCILISSFIWLSMSLSRVYSKDYIFPVIFENIPVNKKIKKETIFLKTKISASGWDLMTRKIKNRKIIIDLKKYPNENALNFSNTKSLVSENFNDLNIIETSPSFFTISFEELQTKKVSIKINFESDLPNNFFLSEDPKSIPDSIEVSSNKSILENLLFIETELISIKKEDTILKKINLIIPENVNSESKTITGVFKIEEYTELEFTVTINIENKPENVDLVFYPQEIKVKCLIPFSEFKKNMASDFYISVDFNNIEVSKDNTAFISIKESPKKAKNIQLEKDKIEFIIYSN